MAPLPSEARWSPTPHLPRPSRSIFNSDHLTTKPCLKFLGIGLRREAPDVDVLATTKKIVALPVAIRRKQPAHQWQTG
jgi:hypothetical protein